MHSVDLCKCALCLITQCLLLPDMFAVLGCEPGRVGRAQQHKVLSVHAEYEESPSVDNHTNLLMVDMLQFNICAVLWANGTKIRPSLLVSSAISGTFVTDVHSCGRCSLQE